MSSIRIFILLGIIYLNYFKILSAVIKKMPFFVSVDYTIIINV